MGRVDHLSLTKSEIRGAINLAEFEAKYVRASGLVLSESTTIGPISVTEKIDLSGAQFGQRVRILVDAENLCLSQATFLAGGRVDVQRADIELDRLVTGGPLVVAGDGSAAVTSISDADAGSLALSRVDLQRCFFYGAHKLESLVLEPTVNLSVAPRLRARRHCIADEVVWRSRNSTFWRKDWSVKPLGSASERKRTKDEPRQLTPAQVASVYRALRKSLESQEDKPGAADFYYGEMEMRRRDSSTAKAERGIIWLYWLMSGYGLRASRALLGLLITYALTTILMLRYGLEKSGLGIEDGLIVAAESLVPGLGVGDPLTNTGRAVDVVMTIVGPTLLGLAILALRNRVMR